MKANSPHLHSLRSRVILFSTTISILIVLISVSGYYNFKNLHNKSSTHLVKRNELSVRLSSIRSELLNSYKALNYFLLTPENKSYQENILLHVNGALRISNDLTKDDWILKYKRVQVVSILKEKLNLLKNEVADLIAVRINANNQYPSLAVGADIMQPNRDILNNSIALSINEMDSDNAQIENPKAYRTLIQVRHVWSQVLSNSRLYLANRVGTFNKNALPLQEKSIEVMFNELRVNIIELQSFANAGKLGFETTDAVSVMLDSSNAWYQGFKKVKIINHSDEWRQDAKIMKDIISPSIDSIIVLIDDLESVITESSIDDVSLVTSFSNTQNITLWLIALVGVIFTVITIFSLDKLVFKPIKVISQALKLEALGKKTESQILIKSKETEGLINAFYEMSHKVHARQTELEYRALHDALTTLPNRTLLLDRIAHDINIAKRESHKLSLLVLDLDDFKEVNDTLGHHVGDSLLIEVGQRIKKVLREVDTVARIGGDEFSILLPHTDEDESIITSQKILSSFIDNIEVDGVNIAISASIGIAVFPEHGSTVEALLRHADVAMYVAKRNKIGFEVYSEESDKNSLSRLSLIRDFREAIAKSKLSIHFQPVYDFNNKNIISIEALSRWIHPEHGFVSPEKFIPLAEQTGLINNLTYWVLDKAIELVSKWRLHNEGLSLAVNLSVLSFKDVEFIGEVRSVLKKYNFPASKLKFEITEGAMMENPLQAIDVLTELREIGIKLSIDDFGTGFSSMAYLQQLPVDELKIDKSFVINLEAGSGDEVIVRSTIDLAHNLGLKVVAEGIESREVYSLLQNYNCDMAQGYYLSRPIPEKEIESLLKSN